MIDGWQRGFAGRLTARHEYLRQVPTITDIPEAVRTFSSRILDFQPNSWITHVSGHPPGALLTFVWLDRIGLGGGAWAGLWCLLLGVIGSRRGTGLRMRALSGEETARLVWRRSSPWHRPRSGSRCPADGYFAGVAAWGIALLALAVRRAVRWPLLAAVAAGVGAGLGDLPQLRTGPDGPSRGGGADLRGVVARCGSGADPRGAGAHWQSSGAFAIVGFWWFDGYILVQQRYWQGIALNRPFQYWSWANLASAVCAIGLGSVAGIGPGIRHRGDQAALRAAPAPSGGAGGDRLRRSVDAVQGRDGTDLVTVRGLAHRRRRPAAGPSPAMVVEPQRDRRSGCSTTSS